MKVLVLGAAGMLGHKILQQWSDRWEVVGTVRQTPEVFRDHGVLGKHTLIGPVDAADMASIARAIDQVRPSVIVNCIGLVKQHADARDAVSAIAINALFPHQLASLCAAADARLLHISTDCVFSGRLGMYTEQSAPDAGDLYGRSKLLGEVTAPALTVRTSIVGRELAGSHGLFEWAIGNRCTTIRGFRRAIFSGFTTIALALLLADIVEKHPQLCGLWHVSSPPIDKYRLLHSLNDALQLGLTIEPDDALVCDRSLDSSALRDFTGIKPPSWEEMMVAFAADPTPYEELRGQ